MSWGCMMVCWIVWMLVPVCLGQAFAFLMASSVTNRADVHEQAAGEYAHMTRVLPVVWILEQCASRLGRFGPAFRLSLWPLWFPHLWLIVDGSKERTNRPWR